jgi:hypothetical protein
MMGTLPHIADTDLGLFDFFDFGAGDGASLVRCEEMFGGRGLGIDIDPAKISSAEAMGREVVWGDITRLPRRKMVRYVCLDNFLEHLPSLDVVSEVLAVAATVATDFLYIVHPSFEDEAYLACIGLKQFWHDWRGHPTHILLSDFCEVFSELGVGPLDIEFVRPARDSSDSSILPLAAPPDQHHYSEAIHGKKPCVVFAKPIYWQLRITVHLRGPAGPADSDERLKGLEQQLQEVRSRRSVRLSSGIHKWRIASSLPEHVSAARQLGRTLRRR